MEKDYRNIINGSEIYSSGYSDQPYIVKADDGAWLCTMTTGSGHEGQKGQHVVTMRSLDKGKSWQGRCALEPSDGPESAYSVLLKVPGGRIFVFYAYNSQNIREVPADPGPTFNGICRRVDCLGDFVFRYSDDHGKSWSENRYCIDVREMAIDRENVLKGKTRFFWNVGKPFFYENSAFVPLIKIGGFGEGCYTRTEGVLLKCENIGENDDPTSLKWETLPDGDSGLKTPPGGGLIAEEQSYSVLSDGSFFCVYRSVDGYPVCTYSRDGGHVWSASVYMSYADGRLIKHPRAANFAWKCSNGKFLYWFHNHGGQSLSDRLKLEGADIAYDDRNPVWLCAGEEYDTEEGKCIKWSYPEIILYHDDPFIRISYPDLTEDSGNYFITETQKTVARVHQVDRKLIDSLFSQFQAKKIVTDGLVLNVTPPVPLEIEMPHFSEFNMRNHSKNDGSGLDMRVGFSIDIWISFTSVNGRKNILDSRDATGKGICVYLNDNQNITISINDSTNDSQWSTYPVKFQQDRLHHIVIIVDGGPKVISFVVDGIFCDGGNERQFGWGRFSPFIKNINGSKFGKLSADINSLRIYDRYLLTSEAISNYAVGIK